MSAPLAHTPGPWSFEALCFDRKIPIRGGVTAYGRPYTVAHVNRPMSAYAGQDKANARLISAAPDQNAALLALVDRFNRFLASDRNHADAYNILVGGAFGDWQTAVAALAKATGDAS